ncbi:hypothetical protein ABRQ22_17230 [Cellulosimicrobium sp. ES-005]|uniref:Lipoprotein n=1 Tax=Cellulosimicrobium sp. ES-005 TaxID=3163031 RepID=A0AAU8FZD3_9MICO
MRTKALALGIALVPVALWISGCSSGDAPVVDQAVRACDEAVARESGGVAADVDYSTITAGRESHSISGTIAVGSDVYDYVCRAQLKDDAWEVSDVSVTRR